MSGAAKFVCLLVFGLELAGIAQCAMAQDAEPNPTAAAAMRTQSARLIERVNPVYPKVAKERGVQGDVVMHATVAADGSVKDVRVISGPPELTQAAVDAVSKWKYEPYRADGTSTNIPTTITVHFGFEPPAGQEKIIPGGGARAADLVPGRRIQYVRPIYPQAAEEHRLEGTVVMKITIATAGTVRNVRVTCGSPMLTEAAVKAVSQWMYEPYRKAGVAVEADTFVSVDFAFGPNVIGVAGGCKPPDGAPASGSAAAAASLPPAPAGMTRISRGVMAGLLEKKVEPVYPEGSSDRGDIVLLITVSKTGEVGDVQAVSGPESLRPAAMDAVKQWRYRPYEVDSKVIEVQTAVTVKVEPRAARPARSGVAAEDMRAGKVLFSVEPVYPQEARLAGVRGTVVVAMEIDTSGNPKNPTAVSGPDMLHAAAVQAASQYRFSPFLRDGQPVTVRMNIAIKFDTLP